MTEIRFIIRENNKKLYRTLIFLIFLDVESGSVRSKIWYYGNQIYQECVPLCQRSCEMPSLAAVLCAAGCVENLHYACTDDTVRLWLPDGPCIHYEECYFYERIYKYLQ